MRRVLHLQRAVVADLGDAGQQLHAAQSAIALLASLGLRRFLLGDQ